MLLIKALQLHCVFTTDLVTSAVYVSSLQRSFGIFIP